jgi:antitoxin component HigA of HigAB toxin-antitoxin module
MKIKKLLDYAATRLTQREIKEIEKEAQLEAKALLSLQQDVSQALVSYMNKNELGFNEIVRQLGKSPSQVSKIIKGEANITLATVAQISALMRSTPHIQI